MSGRGSFSREEFDRVIRRATELAARDTETTGDFTEAELYRIAGEVGLPNRHVRAALVELRTGEAGPEAEGALTRIFGPETVRTARVVPGTMRELARVVDEFMVAGQLLQPVRRSPKLLQYRPAVDWISQLARAASSTSRRYFVASAKRVEIRFEELTGEETGVLVEIEVDPGTRGEAVGEATLGLVVGGGVAGAGVGIFTATVAPVAVAVAAGVVVGGTLGAVFTSWLARGHRRKIRDVQAEVEGVLDRIEAGEPLEPPPPSWRKWVERQFHGARKLMDEWSVEDEL